MRSRTAVHGTLVLLLLACASTPVPEATGPIDWRAVADAGTPEIVTIDADGDVRETKLWIVVLDGRGFIRTGDTRWFKNIQRDPNLVLRIGGAAYPLRATLERNEQVRQRAHEAFRAKYGFSDRFIGWFSSRDASNVLRLDPR
jgi:hypothetical protein